MTKLEREGYILVPEEKEFPVMGDMFYYVTESGGQGQTYWKGGPEDFASLDFGNVFKTWEDALAWK